MTDSYYQNCRYCGKSVRGRQGIRAHLRGCPYTSKGRDYIFGDRVIVLVSTPRVLEFFDTILSKLHSTDYEAFLWLIEHFPRRAAARFEYHITTKTDSTS